MDDDTTKEAMDLTEQVLNTLYREIEKRGLSNSRIAQPAAILSNAIMHVIFHQNLRCPLNHQELYVRLIGELEETLQKINETIEDVLQVRK